MDLINLEMFDFEGKLRVQVNHQSAQEVADIDARVDAEIAAKKKKASQPKPKLPTVSISLPTGAKNVEVSATELKFNIGNGKAKPFAESLRKKFKQDKWKETEGMLDAMFGLIILEKDEQSLQINYVETGILPAEVTISARGVELERAKSK
ncbi:MAG: hypothetical protein FJ267_14500 [Planctomycetes bacterium]|nr:hypothetical protein [Planctomycetota bacterium]